jgi:hypothetical protein
MNDRRHPHPALVATVAAAVTLAATLLTQKATQPPAVIFSGVRTSPLVIDRPGTFVFPAGATVRLGPQDAARHVIACQIRASGVTVENLTTEGGFRSYSVQAVNNTTFRHCVARHGGSSVSGGAGHTGSGDAWLCNNGSNLTLEDCTSENEVGGHAFYIAQEWHTARLRRCVFRYTEGQPVGLVQFNSQGGRGFSGIECDDCTFQGNGAVNQVLNLCGAGSPADPIKFVRCAITGGKRTIVAFAQGVSSGPCDVLLQDCTVSGPQVAVSVQDRSRIKKLGSTKITGQIKLETGGVVQ